MSGRGGTPGHHQSIHKASLTIQQPLERLFKYLNPRWRAFRRQLRTRLPTTASELDPDQDLPSSDRSDESLFALSLSPSTNLADHATNNTRTDDPFLSNDIRQERTPHVTEPSLLSTSISCDPSPFVQPVFTPTRTTGASNHIKTEQTTPYSRTNRHHDRDSISTLSLSLDTSEKNRSYIMSVYMMRGNSEKIGVRLKLDTGSEQNIISTEIAEILALSRDVYDGKLYPLQTANSPTHEIETEGIIRQVEWQIENGPKTFTSDFVVLNTEDFDAILGEADILQFELLVAGPGLQQRGEVRDLSS